MKREETLLDSLIEGIKEDYGSDWNIPVRDLFLRLLSSHWNEIKSELKNEPEILAEISKWDEVVENVHENDLMYEEEKRSFEDVFELFKKSLKANPIDAEQFKREIMCDFDRTLTIRR